MPDLRPRQVWSKPPVNAFRSEIHTGAIVVKFADLKGFRAVEGVLASPNRIEAEAVMRIGGAYLLSRAFTFPDEDLLRHKRCGEWVSSRVLADLSQYFVFKPRTSRAADEHEATISALNAFDFVELAYFETKAAPLPFQDIFPVTNFSVEATLPYLDAAPGGVDARYAWTIPGGRGEYAKILDIEWGWNTAHEDLKAPFTGVFGVPNADGARHGTATLGVLIGDHNGFGIAGISPLSPYALAVGTDGVAQGINTANAIAWGVGLLSAGDVILLELQTIGPIQAGQGGQQGLCGTGESVTNLAVVPVEFEPVIFDAIELATANRIVVVEAAGNGAVDLADPGFQGVFDPSSPNFRDSGAIMVGASMANAMPFCASNFGARVDVRAQGERFPSAWGFRDPQMPWEWSPPPPDNEDNRQWYGFFSGTSSASAIIAGASAVAQSIQKARGGLPLSSPAMRTLLAIGATPQGADPRNIGPMPNLAAMHLWMLGDLDGDGLRNVDELAAGRRPDLSEAALLSAILPLLED